MKSRAHDILYQSLRASTYGAEHETRSGRSLPIVPQPAEQFYARVRPARKTNDNFLLVDSHYLLYDWVEVRPVEDLDEEDLSGWLERRGGRASFDYTDPEDIWATAIHWSGDPEDTEKFWPAIELNGELAPYNSVQLLTLHFGVNGSFALAASETTPAARATSVYKFQAPGPQMIAIDSSEGSGLYLGKRIIYDLTGDVLDPEQVLTAQVRLLDLNEL